jgi:TonB-linked SusC/RagA family outer membrane protein
MQKTRQMILLDSNLLKNCMQQLLLMVFFTTFTNVYATDAQNALKKKITYFAMNKDVRTVLTALQKEGNVRFTYSSAVIPIKQKIDISVQNEPLSAAMDQLYHQTGIQYKSVGEQIILQRTINPHPESKSQDPSTKSPEKIIKGVVKDDQENPLPGVSIVVKGTSIGTTTGMDGSFEIDLTTDAQTLVFSFVGYEPKEINVLNESIVNIVLQTDEKSLNEVVVVGYGTQKKVNLTGSVSAVTGQEIAKRPVGKTSTALQGAVPGLTVTQTSGQPGRDGSTLRIRGIGTTGNSDPLVIVDGVESNLNNIDPNEIESISVLKDASSAAIYGSRASNGVILVTTKRGNSKGFNVNYTSYAGWQAPTSKPKIVNGLDHMLLINDAYINTGRSTLYSDQAIDEYKSKGLTDRDRYPDTDWQKLTMTENGFMQSHYVGITGGTDRVKVLGSFGYLDQNGVIPNTNFKYVHGYISPSDRFNRAFFRNRLYFSLDAQNSCKSGRRAFYGSIW